MTIEDEELDDDKEVLDDGDDDGDGKDGEEENAPEDTRDYETEAVRMGWADEDSWQGPPDRWVDAKKFVQRGDEFLPYLKADRNRLLDQVRDLNSKMTERDKRFDQYQEHQKSLLDIERKRKDAALATLKEQKKQALDDNDGGLVVAIEDQMKEIEKITIPEFKDETPTPVQDNPQEHPDFITWRNENDWYVKSQILNTYADGVANRLMTQGTELRGRDFLNEVGRITKQEMHDKFANPNRKKPGAVASGRIQGQQKKKGGFSSLPSEAKKACEGFVEEGLYANTPEGRDEYAKEFFEITGEG